jgi:hypothetical protein
VSGAQHDHPIAVPEQGAELVVHVRRAGVERQELPDGPGRQRAATGKDPIAFSNWVTNGTPGRTVLATVGAKDAMG